MLTCALFALLTQTQEPAARSGVGAARIAGTAYVVGGATTEGAFAKDLLAYEINARKWTTRASLPEQVAFPAVVAAGGRLYVFGGLHTDGSACGHTRVYDPALDKWSNLGNIPTPRSRAAAAVSANKVILIGGIGPDGKNSPRVESYDTVSKLWGRLEPLKSARHGHVAQAVRDRIVVAGGYAGDDMELTASVEVYEPGKGWSDGPSLPETRGFAQSIAYQNSVWVFGNRGGAMHPVRLDPNEGAWKPSKAFDVTRHRGGAVELGGRVYLLFGEEAEKTVAVFDFVRDDWSR